MDSLGKFYMRELPTPPCVDMRSSTGQAMVRQALDALTAVPFFHVISQFRTQDQPAFCGLGTLVMALNALEIDPGRTWKGVWRWFDESLLGGCKDLSLIEKEGITLEEFICIAICNRARLVQCARAAPAVAQSTGINTTIQTAPPRAAAPAAAAAAIDCSKACFGCKDLVCCGTVEHFREAVVKNCTGTFSTVLCCSYSRKGLGQTGGGHFTPIGAYEAKSDSVLLLDVARFKYPPHWVPLAVLFGAMANFKDSATNQARGWVVLGTKSCEHTVAGTDGLGETLCEDSVFQLSTQAIFRRYTDYPIVAVQSQGRSD